MYSPRFNRTNENIEWAFWSWNPFTGCLGPKGDSLLCDYCYAKDIAKRFPENFSGFKPTFHSDRLDAPFQTKIPKKVKDLPGVRNVFLCSMGDLAHAEKADVRAILKQIRGCEREQRKKNPKFPPWNFIILTKVPEWLPTIKWPSNVWVGATVDIQERVQPAVEAMAKVKAPVKFISCEPLLEPVSFLMSGVVGLGTIKVVKVSGRWMTNGLSFVDWVIVGARSRTSTGPEFQPEWKWVERILAQARQAKCRVFFKPNLKTVPREYPDVD